MRPRTTRMRIEPIAGMRHLGVSASGVSRPRIRRWSIAVLLGDLLRRGLELSAHVVDLVIKGIRTCMSTRSTFVSCVADLNAKGAGFRNNGADRHCNVGGNVIVFARGDVEVFDSSGFVRRCIPITERWPGRLPSPLEGSRPDEPRCCGLSTAELADSPSCPHRCAAEAPKPVGAF